MHLNYFCNTGSQPFKGIEYNFSQQKLLSLWRGHAFTNFVSSSAQQFTSVFNKGNKIGHLGNNKNDHGQFSPGVINAGVTNAGVINPIQASIKKINYIAHYPVEQFFSDSLNYSISRIQEIQEDLALNPISPAFEKTVKRSQFSLKKFLTIGVATFALQLAATAIHNNAGDVESDFIHSQQVSSLQESNVNNLNAVHQADNKLVHNFVNAQQNLNQDIYASSVLNTNLTNTNLTNTNNTYKNLNTVLSSNIAHNNLGLSDSQVPHSYQASFTDFLKQSISNPNPIESLRQDTPKAAVKLPKYMQSMFHNKTDAFLHVLNVTEGKMDRFYRDNKGVALASGWNPTRNSLDFNLNIAQVAGLDSAQTAAIVRLSNTTKINFVPKDLKKMRFTNEQVQKISLALMPHYEQGFLDAMALHSARHGRNIDKDMQAYHDLPNNQQAVMIHMAYKVGGENLVNYKTFYKKLFSYMDNPNKANLNQVQKNFQYTFATLDGERLHDSRVEDIHTSFFSDCAINANPHSKEKVALKINQCRNVANLTNKSDVEDIRHNVAGIQSKMSKIFG